MPEIIMTGYPRTTDGIYNIIGLITEHPDLFECLVKISKTDQDLPGLTRQAWAALFRERDKPAPLVVYVNHWGTNFGPKQGGEGAWGYACMESFIEEQLDQSRELIGLDWNEIDEKTGDLIASSDQREAIQGWRDLITLEIYPRLDLKLPRLVYEPNEKWKETIKVSKGT